jgi:glutamine amidotransferase
VIAIIDYGAGNLRSVTNSLVKLGYQPNITSDPRDVLNADAVIFPGVGAAAGVMNRLIESGMDDAIRQVISADKSFFAVCIGMQVLLSFTEEDGGHNCLDIIPGSVRRLPQGQKVPHMGWNQVTQKVSHPIFDGIQDEANFYFVHSYYPDPDDAEVVAGTSEYGINWCSMLIKGNLVATQFHPEKSGDDGLRMYDNFLNIALRSV